LPFVIRVLRRGEAIMLKTYAPLAAAVLTTLGLAQAAPAAGPGKDRDPEKIFRKLDTNADGKLSLEELKARGKKDPAKLEKRFSKLDTNGDKSVTLEELKAGLKKKRG
jgi:hypothetical protein